MASLDERGMKTRRLSPPPGYAPPPPPPLADALRTIRVALTDLVPYAARLAAGGSASSTTEHGLASIRAQFRETLERLGVELHVHHAERVPRHGGLLLFWNQESHLDHLVLPSAIPRPFICLYNNEIARTPLYGAHMRRTGHVHVDRTDEAQWRATARASSSARRGRGAGTASSCP